MKSRDLFKRTGRKGKLFKFAQKSVALSFVTLSLGYWVAVEHRPTFGGQRGIASNPVVIIEELEERLIQALAKGASKAEQAAARAQVRKILMESYEDQLGKKITNWDDFVKTFRDQDVDNALAFYEKNILGKVRAAFKSEEGLVDDVLDGMKRFYGEETNFVRGAAPKSLTHFSKKGEGHPHWAFVGLRNGVRSGKTTFFLDGNVTDMVGFRAPNEQGVATNYFIKFKDYLESVVLSNRHIQLSYVPGEKLKFANETSLKEFHTWYKTHLKDYALPDINLVLQPKTYAGMPANRGTMFDVLETFFRDMAKENKTVGFVAYRAQELAREGAAVANAAHDAPMKPGQFDGGDLKYFARLAEDEELAGKVTAIAVSDDRGILAKKLKGESWANHIEVPESNYDDRLSYLQTLIENNPKLAKALGPGVTTQTLAEDLPMLDLKMLDQFVNDAYINGRKIVRGDLTEKGYQYIENMLNRGDEKLVERMHQQGSWDSFNSVGEDQKNWLRGMTRSIRNKDFDSTPTSLLELGVYGMGKSLMPRVAAGEAGIAAFKILNMQSKWVGETEARMYELYGVAKRVAEGRGQMMLFWDEIDKVLNPGGKSGGAGKAHVDGLKAILFDMMADPRLRGKITIIGATARGLTGDPRDMLTLAGKEVERTDIFGNKVKSESSVVDNEPDLYTRFADIIFIPVPRTPERKRALFLDVLRSRPNLDHIPESAFPVEFFKDMPLMTGRDFGDRALKYAFDIAKERGLKVPNVAMITYSLQKTRPSLSEKAINELEYYYIHACSNPRYTPRETVQALYDAGYKDLNPADYGADNLPDFGLSDDGLVCTVSK